MQIGDLVKHKRKGWVGLITDQTESRLESTMAGFLWHIQWNSSAEGEHWSTELEVIRESR